MNRIPPTAEAISAALGDSALWTTFDVRASTGSTNADAAAAVRDGGTEGLVVTTHQQAGGRGRLDRSWESPEGAGIALSVVLRPDVDLARWVWLPLLVGVAVDDAVRDLGVESSLKWPNDVMVDDRKLCGILLERVEGPTGPHAVVGIGLNVSLTADELPVAHATSLALEGADELDRSSLIGLVLRHLEHQYAVWLAVEGDPAPFLRDDYLERCGTVGREVRVTLPSEDDLVGVAETVDEHGRLVVAGRPVSAGDVTHVRPTTA